MPPTTKLTTAQTTQSVPIRLRDDYQQLKIVLVGCGGNGSHMAEAIARVGSLLTQQGQKVDLLFIDPDYVEKDNIPRQNFSEAEIGLNKAQTLALRYSAKWGVTIKAIPASFERNMLHYYSELTILLGCVDNPAGRAALAQCLEQNNQERSPRVWWLDLGNGLDTGQVVLGSANQVERLKTAFYLSSVCTITPSAACIHPELVTEQSSQLKTKTVGEQSCAQLAMTNAQMPAVNQMTAAIGAAMLTKLLVTCDLKYWASYFDLSTGKQVSYATSPAAIEDALVNVKSTGKLSE